MKTNIKMNDLSCGYVHIRTYTTINMEIEQHFEKVSFSLLSSKYQILLRTKIAKCQQYL